MKKYYVTFGQKYRHDPHPMVKYADPDGYLIINAKNAEEARIMAFDELGEFWSNIYKEEDFDFSWYPLGKLHEI